MTATKLQMVLGEAIDKIRNIEGDSAARKKEIEKLEVLLKMAKNHINNSQVILVFNYRAEQGAIKAEVERLSDRKKELECREERILAIIDRECAGEKRDLGIAEVGYRKSTSTEVDNAEQAINWLETHGYDDCLKYTEPSVVKSKVKALISKQGIEIPGVHLEEKNNMSLK